MQLYDRSCQEDQVSEEEKRKKNVLRTNYVLYDSPQTWNLANLGDKDKNIPTHLKLNSPKKIKQQKVKKKNQMLHQGEQRGVKGEQKRVKNSNATSTFYLKSLQEENHNILEISV